MGLFWRTAKRQHPNYPVPVLGTKDAPVVAIDIGKFGTACSWNSSWDPVPAVRTLDTKQPHERIVRKSPNSLLVHRDNVSVVSLGDIAEKSYACGSCPVGAKLFRRFGRQRMRVESDPTSESAVKCSRNRSEMKLSKILFYLLMHARDAALKNLGAGEPVSVAAVKWVLTVPSSLTERQRNILRNSAVMAGLVNNWHDDEGLKFCPEPIAACLAFQDRLDWQAGKTYLVVDCGGVTVDIHAVRVCATEKRELCQLHRGRSGPWGAETLDILFDGFLEGFIASAACGASKQAISSFWNSSAKLRIMLAWETGKVGWKDENDECRIDLTELGNDPLEVTMEDMDRARDDKNGHGEELVGGHGTWVLVLKPAWMRKAFQKPIERISQAVSEQLDEPELRGIKSVVMVGGFSENFLVQEAIRTCILEKHPNVNVLVHARPSLAIAEGATFFTSQGDPDSAELDAPPEPPTIDMWPAPVGVLEAEPDDTISDRVARMIIRDKTRAILRVSPSSSAAPGPGDTEEVHSNAFNVVEVVARAAQELADRSTVPGVPEVATLLLVILSLATERRDCVAEATLTANWCSGILHILDDADRVLREDKTGGGTTWVKSVQDAVSNLLQLIKTYKSSHTIIQVITSQLFKHRKEQLEAVVKRAMDGLNVKMGVHIGSNVNAIVHKVDRITDDMHAVRHNMDKMIQDDRLQDSQPRLSEKSAVSVSDSLAEARRRRRQQKWGEIEIPEGDVEILDRLGKGGFGEVYMADYMGENVAVKIINVDHGLKGFCLGKSEENGYRRHAPTAERASKQQKQFMHEVDTMYRLKSPHTVLFHGVITSRKDRLALVMELLEGGDLRAYLRKAKESLPEEDTRRIIGDVCAGMAFLHENETIHGDLKSANVLLDRNGRAKIGDFGTSRTTKQQTSTCLVTRTAGHGSTTMTLQWTAPEIFYGEGASYASDMYSFGVVIWEVLSREIPWSELAGNPAICFKVATLGERPAIPTGTPPDIEDIMKLCWAQQPQSRPTFRRAREILPMI
ncbi:unnamed protein product [Ectocarpus fasciculatus]